MAPAPSFDLGFYEAVHQLLGSAGVEAEQAERRGDVRHPYPCYQWIAPCPGERVPPQWTFRQVECIDVSHNGLAFYSPERPEVQTVAVGLKRGEAMTYLAANIVRCKAMQHLGQPMFLVGCRFTGRLGRLHHH